MVAGIPWNKSPLNFFISIHLLVVNNVVHGLHVMISLYVVVVLSKYGPLFPLCLTWRPVFTNVADQDECTDKAWKEIKVLAKEWAGDEPEIVKNVRLALYILTLNIHVILYLIFKSRAAESSCYNCFISMFVIS